ncbi:hypothetical protein C8F01DRAFT_1149915 [Mycena amicta]|nr:hypothetical protein C8F01DRAFT_1149915 [Mycena amicta]
MFSVSSAIVALALTKTAFAALAFTAPTASIGAVGGQPFTLVWKDDGTAPLLSAYGPCKASIYAGNAAQQTSLQTISESVDPSNPLSLTFTVNATIGPNSDQYFIRFEALNTKDPNNAAIPLLAFSHQFTLSGMTGAFSAEVQSEINGQSTAPIGGGAPTSTSASTPATSVQTTASAPKSTGSSPSASKSSSKSAAPSGSSAAVPRIAMSAGQLWVGVGASIVGAVVGAALL